MSNAAGFHTDHPVHPAESGVERLARIQRERVLVARAEADIDAGLGVDWDEVEPWLHALDIDETALEPPPVAPAPVRR